MGGSEPASWEGQGDCLGSETPQKVSVGSSPQGPLEPEEWVPVASCDFGSCLETDYVICRAQDKMKMRGPLFKSVGDFKICRLHRAQGLGE